MNSVWIVHHFRPETDVYLEDVKLIGVYRTKADGEAAVQRLKEMPGFRDWPDDFFCEEYLLNKDHWIEGFIFGDDDLSAENVS